MGRIVSLTDDLPTTSSSSQTNFKLNSFHGPTTYLLRTQRSKKSREYFKNTTNEPRWFPILPITYTIYVKRCDGRPRSQCASVPPTERGWNVRYPVKTSSTCSSTATSKFAFALYQNHHLKKTYDNFRPCWSSEPPSTPHSHWSQFDFLSSWARQSLSPLLQITPKTWEQTRDFMRWKVGTVTYREKCSVHNHLSLGNMSLFSLSIGVTFVPNTCWEKDAKY